MEPSRRTVIGGLISTAGIATIAPADPGGGVRTSGSPARVMTVRGWVPAGAMGVALVHEHALANFAGYTSSVRDPHPYRDEDVIAILGPRLAQLKARTVSTFVDATASFLGRDPILLRKLSVISGLNILTVTGNYAAFANRFLPPWAFTDTPRRLASRWEREWRDGIGGSGVRPGLIKLGFNGGPLSAVERNLIRAAAIAHLRTGLTIGAHTGPAEAAFPQLDELDRAGVHPSAWIWIHAQNEPDIGRHIEAARRGAWIEFDGIDAKTIDQHVTLVSRMADKGLLGQILVSQDAGWYSVGEPNGRTKARSYTTIFDHFIPTLKSRGFGDAEVSQLLVTNPARAFAVSVRRVAGTE